MDKKLEIIADIRNKLQTLYLIIERTEYREDVPAGCIDLAIRELEEAKQLLKGLKVL